MMKVTVLYGIPTSPEQFEKHYKGTHLPLASKMKDVALKAGLRFMDIENKYPGSIPFSLATGLIKIRDDINFQENSEGLS